MTDIHVIPIYPRLTLFESALVKDVSNTKILEEFWEQHKSNDEISERDTDSPMDSPSSIKYRPTAPKTSRNRSVSDGTALVPPGHNLSAYHPAWSLLNLLETLGPLIFPIHRAALLRKRILITGHAPVQETCNFGRSILLESRMKLIVYSICSLCTIEHSYCCYRSPGGPCPPSTPTTTLLHRYT